MPSKPKKKPPVLDLLTLMGNGRDDREEVKALLANIKAHLPQLESLLEKCSGEWGYEDPIYRYYHGSFKVAGARDKTEAIVKQLQVLSPGTALNPDFMDIVRLGTEEVRSFRDLFGVPHEQWRPKAAPVIEAFLHARYFLEMAVKYGRELKIVPMPMPSGWAALLTLYCVGFGKVAPATSTPTESGLGRPRPRRTKGSPA